MTSAAHRDHDETRVKVPADVGREDRILAGLTARQLAILAVPAVGSWAGWAALHTVVPVAVLAAVAVPVAVAAVVLALGRRDGMTADRLALAALRHLTAPRRLIPTAAGEAIRAVPDWVGVNPGPPPAPLRLPIHGVGADGIVDLGSDGAVLLCRAAAGSFALRTPTERQALGAAFGRWLNSLPGGAQVLIRAEPVDLDPAIAVLRQNAGGLPHPALEAAAVAHATFLESFAADRDLLRRHVLIVLRDPGGPGAGDRLARRAADNTGALAAAGVTITALDGPAAARVLAATLDPWAPPPPAGLALPAEIITGAAP